MSMEMCLLKFRFGLLSASFYFLKHLKHIGGIFPTFPIFMVCVNMFKTKPLVCSCNVVNNIGASHQFSAAIFLCSWLKSFILVF